MTVRSISSTAEGPCPRMTFVASMASIRSWKCTAANPLRLGTGTRFTLAADTTASVPSEPTTILARFIAPSSANSSRL